jgi:hypothetical protein
MKRSLLFVALILVISAGCRRSSFKSPEPEPSGNQGGGGVMAGGGGPGVMGIRGAVTRDELENALKQIQIFIENASGAEGTMPSVQTTYAALQREAPKYAKYIDDRIIVINPAKTREEVWAYAALPQGNYSVLTSSGIERKTKQELDAMLAR